MMLRDIRFKAVYRSESDNILKDFYLPALSQSVSYDRAVGFFSASMLSYAAQGISALIENDGKMRLIFGGDIDKDEADAIVEGYDCRGHLSAYGSYLIGQIDSITELLSTHRLKALSWLVASGKLEIKFALKQRGMYHEKIGIFTDAIGERVVFQGSANETLYALLPDFNFESINVFPSWRPEFAEYCEPYVEGFETLWGNKSKSTLVIDFPSAAKERLIKIANKVNRPPSPVLELNIWQELLARHKINDLEDESVTPGYDEAPRLPDFYKGGGLEVRPHQRQALIEWKNNNYRGVLAMATGAGKTVTSIYGVVKLFSVIKRLFLVVSVPYQPLADQWVEELAIFNINAIRCYESASKWIEKLSTKINLFENGVSSFCACVVVNKTLMSPEFQSRISRVNGADLMFIGDECHHHGAELVATMLPEARFRLGLSATPKHYFDDERTARIINYYGSVVYEYVLVDALRDGVLAPYKYYVHLVELNDEELLEYKEISDKIARSSYFDYSEDFDGSGGDYIESLMFMRARILGGAKNKLVKLKEILRGKEPINHSLFYCSDAVSKDEELSPVRQLEAVTQILNELGWRASKFTASESRQERQDIINNFRIGIINSLVAIRCLDEGVDIPDCKIAFILASSRNPKQFIQRRGRILRRSPGKEFAIVHDFLVVLPDLEDASGMNRKLIINELKRVSEFASLALNRHEVYNSLKPVLSAFQVESFFV